MSNDPTIEQTLRDLTSGDQTRKIAALKRLRGVKDKRLATLLIPLLRDVDANIRRLAAEILGTNEAAEAVSGLSELLDDPDEDIRIVAAYALNAIGTPEALAALEKLRGGNAFEDADERLREIPADLFNEFLNSEQPKTSSIPPPITELSPERSEPNAQVLFSAYSPRETAPNVWKPLRAYVYIPGAANAVAADATRELGDQLSSFREVSRPAQSSIAEGALITATPELAGFQFNPPSAQIAFYDDWQRFAFKLRAVSAPLDQAVNGRITFTVEGVIVADVPLAVYVGANAVEITAPPVTRPLYESIFCSYSHKDTQIVERVERAYKALGMTFLRDVVALKSGQDWNAELLKMIDRADIFQLFWSPAAADSKYVREEWMRALSKKREGFIRPVFWEQPLAPPPAELAALHFAYQPDLDDA